MKWLITKFLMWFHNRRWNGRYQLVLASTESTILTCEIFSKCLEAFNPYLIKGVPRANYIEHDVVTSTTNILDAKQWLSGYVATLREFNKYYAAYKMDKTIERPNSSYIDNYGVQVTEPLSINLHDYMRIGSNEYTHQTLLSVLDLINEASAELLKIDDEIEYDYFTRRASYVVNDIWAVLSTFIKANKLYEIS